MAEAGGELAASSRRVIALNPFEYFPTRRSALGGLGGTDGFSDPSYAFHTRYAPCAPGPITFVVRLRDLTVTHGDLTLRVHMLPNNLSADAKQVKTAQVPLVALEARDGEVSIEVKARRGMKYALLGYVPNETDAMVSAISVTLDRLDHSSTDTALLVDDERTRFGGEAARPIAMLLAEQAPSLAAPLSQALTAGQFEDRNARRWAAELGISSDENAWPAIYVARVLETYGMIGEDARGLAFGEGASHQALVAALETRGCAVDFDDPDDAVADDADGRHHDFLWSIGVVGGTKDATGASWIEATLDRLRIGGLAVHCFRFRAIPDGDGAGEQAVLSRLDVERLAFALISAGHEAAQLAFAGFDERAARRETWFGLIVRKGGA